MEHLLKDVLALAKGIVETRRIPGCVAERFSVGEKNSHVEMIWG